jgi:uncharacterized membrane protein
MGDLNGFQLVIAAFPGESAGPEALSQLLATFKSNRPAMPAGASIVKDADGALTIKETDDIGAKQGAAAGAVAGGLIGLLSRKRGTVSTAALGALLGGVVAHKVDTGIPDPRLEAIGEALDHSSSAAVAVLRDDIFGEAKALLSGQGAEINTEPFDPKTDFVQQMQAGDYRGALSALANRAESMVASAGGAVGDAAGKIKGV